MAVVEMELDVPDGVEIRGYERIDRGHAFEVDWRLPEEVTCDKCGRCQQVHVHLGEKMHVIRDLDIQGLPAFFVYQPPYHRCDWCCHRQWLIPPFKRKHVTCTLRFEEQVLRMMIGSTEEEVGRRLGISAEMVRQIINHRMKDEQRVAPDRVITDVGMDEISLKKRHKLYATILTDLTCPDQPRILAVAPGRDQTAARACLERLSSVQREQVRTHRTDMSSSYTAACAEHLPNSQQVIDRFHVAQKLGEIVDRVRKKKTRAYKKGLATQARKKFRSQMWAFRKRPQELTPDEHAQLAELFGQIPDLELPYYFRQAITNIFDHAASREEAAQQLEELRAQMDPDDEDNQILLEFFATYDEHRSGILAYFDERKTSGPVEGLNNKARVITKRCYGIKDTRTLWARLCLDVNLASLAVSFTVNHIHDIANQIRTVFLGYYT